MKVQENAITTRGNGAKTIGKIKETGKTLEKYIENAANQRKWCKKETGKNLGKID